MCWNILTLKLTLARIKWRKLKHRVFFFWIRKGWDSYWAIACWFDLACFAWITKKLSEKGSSEVIIQKNLTKVSQWLSMCVRTFRRYITVSLSCFTVHNLPAKLFATLSPLDSVCVHCMTIWLFNLPKWSTRFFVFLLPLEATSPGSWLVGPWSPCWSGHADQNDQDKSKHLHFCLLVCLNRRNNVVFCLRTEPSLRREIERRTKTENSSFI